MVKIENIDSKNINGIDLISKHYISKKTIVYLNKGIIYNFIENFIPLYSYFNCNNDKVNYKKSIKGGKIKDYERLIRKH